MSVDRGVPIEEFASVHLPALQTAARDIVDANAAGTSPAAPALRPRLDARCVSLA